VCGVNDGSLHAKMLHRNATMDLSAPTRFVDESGRGFGILTSQTYNDLAVMTELNLGHARPAPLDLTIVLSGEPIGDVQRSRCITDTHRYYQYIAICNCAEYGGSGMYAPIRATRTKHRHTIFEMGKMDCSIRVENISFLDLLDARASQRRQDVLGFSRHP